MYDEFIRLLFLNVHRETSALTNEFPEESDQFRFLHVSRFTNLKGTVGLTLEKASGMWISTPLDLPPVLYLSDTCLVSLFNLSLASLLIMFILNR